MNIIRNKEVAPAAERVAKSCFPEGESIAEHPVGQSAKDDINGVLHHDVHLVLCRHRATLQQAKPCYGIREKS